MFAHTSLTIDPAWPGASPSTGWMLLAGAALVLAVLTIWSYRGAASGRRIVIVLSLRLLALAVTVLLMLRPSFATEHEDAIEPTRLFVIVDVSKSMGVSDEFNSLTRLKRTHDLLAGAAVQSAFKRLAEQKKVEIVLFQGADEVKRYNPAAEADGKSTDVIRWLEDLRREAGGDIPVQAMLLFSDGVDTGDPVRTLQKAAEFRGKWPLLTYGLGQATTIGQEKDVALDRITVEPQPILAKGKFKVKALVHAPGFEEAKTNFSLWIEDRAAKKMVQVSSRVVQLAQPADNVVEFDAAAPDVEGEIKITVKAEPLPGETNKNNNEISTYAYVSKEGVRILWVEGSKRAYEGVFAIRHALAKDRRFSVVYVERGKGLDKDVDPYRFDQTAYDVVVIGDISGERFGNDELLRKIRDRVQNQGMGLVMLGGYETFGNSDWQRTPLADLFPIRCDRPGQVEGKVAVEPTLDGLKYLCRLSDDDKVNERIWTKSFGPLEGMSQPGTLDPRATVMATRADDKTVPIMAGALRGKGRVLSFTGDTTWQAWRRNPDAAAAYERFWRQMILWLAQQENSQGSVFVQLDARRLDRPKQLGFRVGFRGVEVPDAKFTAKIVGPKGEVYPIAIGSDPRGVWTPPIAGEYEFHVEGKGKTPLGQPIDGRDVARFTVVETDRELLRPAADHDFLEKLAIATDGKFARADERAILQALADLEARQAPTQVKLTHWPDWRKGPPSDGIGDQFATLWRSMALVLLMVYVACLCVEWYLRRKWGMV